MNFQISAVVLFLLQAVNISDPTTTDRGGKIQTSASFYFYFNQKMTLHGKDNEDNQIFVFSLEEIKQGKIKLSLMNKKQLSYLTGKNAEHRNVVKNTQQWFPVGEVFYSETQTGTELEKAQGNRR